MNYSASEFVKESKAGNIDLVDFYNKLLEDIKKINEKLNLLITISNSLLDEAKRLNKEVKAGKGAGKLFGLPLSVKDNICTKGLRSTAASKILNSYIPPFDATCVARAKAEGGVVIGKTAMDEFGFGTFSVNCAYGVPKNPIDLDRSCGGSSGGAAGLVAALDYPHIAFGQSTGGSIACPASFCGVVGITPTYGLVSRYGLIDYGNSLDKIGPMAKSVEDAALLLSIIAGHDELDQTSLMVEQKDYTKCFGDVKGMQIGVPREYMDAADEKVRDIVWKGVKVFEDMGMACTEVSLPHSDVAIPAYYIIACSEASTNLARYCGMRYGMHMPLHGNFNQYFSSVRARGFGREAKRRIMLGTYARLAGYRARYYLKALKIRTLVIQDFKRAFKHVEVLVAPTMPMIAPRFDEIERLTPLQHWQADVLTAPANLAGIPTISIPCGKVSGMPVGLHLLGDHMQEEKIICVAHAFEQESKVKVK